jgi:lipid-A-disaccharide synthase
MRIGIVAGEASGDLLAASLMQAIQARVPGVEFVGVAGPRMQQLGCRVLYPSEKLAVMGITEVLGRLRELLRIRRDLVRQFVADPPDLFIGVDAPDFNLGLERKLKARGIPTVHFVSPSVWAWRQYRVKKIARSTDLVLCLFPFEEQFYAQRGVAARYVGHPLADMIPLDNDMRAAREKLGLPTEGEIVAILPGSRSMEVKNLGPEFVRTAAWILQRRPDTRFITPVVGAKTRALFQEILAQQRGELPLMLVEGQSHEAMAAADVVLLASGTAALEAMLLKKPMVVAYRISKLSELLVRRMISVPYYSLPNLLAGKKIVEEFVQDEVRADQLGRHILGFLEEPEYARALQARFRDIHVQLRQDAAQQAADAVLELIGHNSAR